MPIPTAMLAGAPTVIVPKNPKPIMRPLQSKSNPQYVNEGKRGLIFADKGRAKNQ